jgi:hypothetical protein
MRTARRTGEQTCAFAANGASPFALSMAGPKWEIEKSGTSSRRGEQAKGKTYESADQERSWRR